MVPISLHYWAILSLKCAALYFKKIPEHYYISNCPCFGAKSMNAFSLNVRLEVISSMKCYIPI